RVRGRAAPLRGVESRAPQPARRVRGARATPGRHQAPGPGERDRLAHRLQPDAPERADHVHRAASVRFEHDAGISGIGPSDVGRRLDRSPLSLTVDAITAAVADAGLSPRDVGAVATYPGGGTALGPGFAGPSAAEVCDALGLDVDVLMGN